MLQIQRDDVVKNDRMNEEKMRQAAALNEAKINHFNQLQATLRSAELLNDGYSI